jgi:hypothetical protein
MRAKNREKKEKEKAGRVKPTLYVERAIKYSPHGSAQVRSMTFMAFVPETMAAVPESTTRSNHGCGETLSWMKSAPMSVQGVTAGPIGK